MSPKEKEFNQGIATICNSRGLDDQSRIQIDYSRLSGGYRGWRIHWCGCPRPQVAAAHAQHSRQPIHRQQGSAVYAFFTFLCGSSPFRVNKHVNSKWVKSRGGGQTARTPDAVIDALPCSKAVPIKGMAYRFWE